MCLVPLAACSVDVGEAESGKNSSVDIRTPVGKLSVRTDVNPADTGLPVYPGATVAHKDDNDKSANVHVGNSFFGVNVVAATLESEAPPQAIVDFYKKEMAAYGAVTECRGEVDFEGSHGSKRPVCKEKASARDVELVVGAEDRQRIVAVKPRGNGSEFALVYVETHGDR